MNKKSGNGGRKSKGVPKEKLGRKFIFPIYNNTHNYIYIANVERFNTVQIHIGGWIKINDDLMDANISHIIAKAKKNIKDRIRKLSLKENYFKQISIVAFDTAVQEKSRIRNYQYINIDVVLYTNNNIYDKVLVKKMMKPIIIDIINEDLIDENVFNFVKKTKGMQQYDE